METTKESRSWVSDNALWAAEAVCCDDDDLVVMLIDAAVANAVAHLLFSDLPYSAEREARGHLLLGVLRSACAQDREVFAKRLHAYLEPDDIPF